MSETNVCPSCKGEGSSVQHHNTGPDSSGHFWAAVKCTLCKGETNKTITTVKAGKKLQKAMRKRGMTLIQAAASFGISAGEMSSVYRGRKSLADAIELAKPDAEDEFYIEHEVLRKALCMMGIAAPQSDSELGSRMQSYAKQIIRSVAKKYPKPAHDVSELVEALELLKKLVSEIERNTCEHEETYRGGVIWEICSFCDAKWADDRGGKPEFKWPECVEQARDLIYSSAQVGDV